PEGVGLRLSNIYSFQTMTDQNRRNFFRKIGLGFFSFSLLGDISLFAGIKKKFRKPVSDVAVFFTNGFKIAEVSGKSAIIWTRLCRQEHPNPVRHKREGKVVPHPIGFDEEQPVSALDGGVRAGPGVVSIQVANEGHRKGSE